jgi:hypothetical protein
MSKQDDDTREAARAALTDARLYGTGLIKVTHSEAGFKYERIDPTEIRLMRRPKPNHNWIDPDGVEEV